MNVSIRHSKMLILILYYCHITIISKYIEKNIFVELKSVILLISKVLLMRINGYMGSCIAVCSILSSPSVAFLFLLYSQSSPPWPPATGLYRNICSHWEPHNTISPPPSQHSVQSKHTNTTCLCYFQKSETLLLCCNMRFWVSYRYRHHHTILIWSSSVQKYDSYKQCLLRHLPSCTKLFRDLCGEKRGKKILHKIIPTGERTQSVLHSTAQSVIMMILSPLFGLNLNLSFSNLISSGVNFFDNLRKKTPTTPQSSATDSSSPRWVSWCFVFDSFV